MMQLTTLDTTTEAPSEYGIRWGSDCPLRAPYLFGATNDLFIIQSLPIYLAESIRACLDHLPRNAINYWDDLWEVFTGNF
jgi:hypothetical protein